MNASQRGRIERQLRLAEQARAILAGRRAPYLAHMRVESAGRLRDVLLATESRSTSALTLIDWRSAPLAEIFFGLSEGEQYELELGDRTVEGVLLERNAVRFDAQGLVEVATPDDLFTRSPGGAWLARPARPSPRLQPRAAERRSQPTSPVEVQLDAAQRRIVELPAQRRVLVLGEAGCGKTTVALHRLAALRRAAGERRFRAAVIVPTDGLRRLVGLLLERLGVHDAEVWLYDRWASQQARLAFPDLPPRESQDAPAGAVRIKRHPALRPLLAQLALRPPSEPDEDEAERLPRSTANARRADLQHLFGDRALLERVAAASGGTINPGMIAETCEHTHVQFSRTSEEEWEHVDAGRLQTLDGRTLDDGTPTEDATTIDPEDYAVLFELDRMRAARGAGPAARLREYDCIVLDEAQELAPLELALVGRSLSPEGALIVAGDADQQVDPTTCFLGWEAAMAELGGGGYERAVLEVSYRCPAAVTAFAHSVLAPASSTAPPREDLATLAYAVHGHDFHRTAWLVEALRDLTERDPFASVAVICRTPDAAREQARLLRRGLMVRLALSGEFAFKAGVTVTCVQEVKGLEFDHVIVPDASPSAYPDSSESRRALYVAATRAVHQLVVASVGAWSPLVLRPEA